MYQALAQGGGKGLMFIAFIFLARMLGPALYGTFDYSLSLIQIIGGIFFELGLTLIVTRDLSMNNLDIFVPALWLKFAGCLLGSVVMLALGNVLHLPLVLALSLVGYVAVNSFTNLYICIFRARGKMYGETITVIVQRATLVIMLVLFYFGCVGASPSLNECGAAFFLSAFVGLILAVFLVKIFFQSLIAYKGVTRVMNKVRVLIKEALPLIGVSIFWLLYYKIDIVLLGMLSSKEQVGFYSSSYRIMEACFLIPLITANAVYPRLSRLWGADKNAFSKDLKRILLGLLVIGALVSVFLYILAKPVILLAFGAEFSPAVGILVLLSLALLAVYPGYIATQTLVIIGRQKSYLLISIIASSMNIILNLIFIPIWQAKGAAVSTIITETMVTCMATFILLNCAKHERVI